MRLSHYSGVTKNRVINKTISLVFIFLIASSICSCNNKKARERLSFNEGWKFFKYESAGQADNLIYDVRPEEGNGNLVKEADAKPEEAEKVLATQEVLKAWILPTANDFIKDSSKHYQRPYNNPGGSFPFVQSDFDDTAWENINLPHDWAIKGPFQGGWNSEVGGGMGRLPVNGVAWYRKKFVIDPADSCKSVFLDIDGAMSYAMVWLNGKLVGGWPYGYNSWRLDLTPYLNFEKENQLSIRLDNPNNSARWYPGGGIYRNVWLTKTDKVHVSQWGTYITTSNVSKASANINLEVTLDNNSSSDAEVELITEVYALDSKGFKKGKAAGKFKNEKTLIPANGKAKVAGSLIIKKPELWGPPPSQSPNLYMAETKVIYNGEVKDVYETRFGIRSIEYNPDKGLIVNGENIKIKGVNQHHDLGSLGAAFNYRAAERQLEILREMGCNAIRMSHNPPAPELLELTDRMGFLVIDEIFDSWERKKTAHDFHLIFSDWSEPDARAFVRRDRNCPSVIIWSFGNEVGEQYTAEAGAAVAKRLYDFIREEDPTRPTILAMNYAKPDMKLPEVPDVIGLNYQGEGIRQAPEFEGTDRIRTAPMYDAFHERFPDKMVLSTETASAFSSRGMYFFPVSKEESAPVRDGRGGNSKLCHVSSYELHAVDFGSSADKVFRTIDQHPFVAGEFVWTGWDHIGEPTPYYEARSSYCGIIDLAGFKKDRFYLYQSHWRPDYPMVHILPHWNWPERAGEITPVHVFTSGDEVELFLNDKSLGKKKKGEFEYRLRWDSIKYEPGELKAVSYKNGEKWAEETVRTSGEPAMLKIIADRSVIEADGKDLSFITVQVADKEGLTVPDSDNKIEFSIEGPGEIIATDNGDQTDLTSFSSKERKAFGGNALVIIRSDGAEGDEITVTATSDGLQEAKVVITTKK
jgi:beta-galactosidase